MHLKSNLGGKERWRRGWSEDTARHHGWFRVKVSGTASPAHGQGLTELAEFINENRRNQPKHSPNKGKRGILGVKDYQLEGPDSRALTSPSTEAVSHDPDACCGYPNSNERFYQGLATCQEECPCR